MRVLAWLLWLVARGYVKRLTVSMPPGHGKSELVDVWFPTWNLNLRPSDRIILSSYEATLAEEWGKRCRDVLMTKAEHLRVRIRQDSQAANRWRTVGGGGMWTMGSGGAVTGRRARVFIVDDPHKNWQEAHSPSQQEQIWDWYRSTARTRLLPGASIVVVQTRWAEADLVGHLTEIPTFVHMVLPAIAEQDETIESIVGAEFIARCRADRIPVPEWNRKAGEALWSWLVEPGVDPDQPDGVSWFNLEELEETRLEVGELIWAGLYQQHPIKLEGSMFKRGNWKYIPNAPADMPLIRRWDLAATEDGGDATAGVLMGRTKRGEVFIVDVIQERLGPKGVEDLILATAQQDKAKYGNVKIRLEQEPGSSGKALTDDYVSRLLAGFDVSAEGSTGDKELRAIPFSAQVEAGNVWLVTGNDADEAKLPPWLSKFVDEAAAFPQGKHDDMIDAACLAYMDHVKLMRRQKKGKVSTVAGQRLNVMNRLPR